MSDHIVRDLAQGVSHFTRLWRVLLWIDLLGWFSILVAGITGLMAVGWFIWVVPLSAVLFGKAALSYFDSLDETEGGG